MDLNLDKDKLVGHAEHLWQFLDDLAENKPEDYQKFLQKQFSEFKEMQKQEKKLGNQPASAPVPTSIELPSRAASSSEPSAVSLETTSKFTSSSAPRKPIIEEIRGSGVVAPKQVEPIYSLRETDQAYILEVELPELVDIVDVDLELAEMEAILESGSYRLKLALPRRIDVDRCDSKFLRPRKVLRVSMPFAHARLG